jgi:hypothetical protein
VASLASTRAVVRALLASAATTAAIRRLPEPAVEGWQRRNFRGRPVSLSGGLAAGIGALAGVATEPSLRRGALIAGTFALVAGAYDDLLAPRSEHGADKGLGGHLSALRSGRISGGTVKIVVIGGGCLLAARQLPGRADPAHAIGSTLLSAGLIAGTANLLNLCDLRPGRAGKVALVAATVSAATRSLDVPMAAVLGAIAISLPDDLGEKTMLGDLGANTLGALIGVRLAAGTNMTRAVAATVVGVLTVASERVSFSRVIESVGALRWFDELGQLPPPSSVGR